MNRTNRIASTMAALGVAIVACAQWNFTVDPTFQTQLVQQNVNSLLLNEDGTLIASGRMRLPGEFSDKTLCRHFSDGIRDLDFNNSALGGGSLKSWQSDKFYVGGTYAPRRIWLETGQNDVSFAVGAMAVPYFVPLQGGDYHVYPDGSVLISGNHQLHDSIRGFVGRHQLIWFTHEGYLDTTRTHRTGGNCAVYRFKELPNGQFICTTTCDQFDGQEIDKIFRVNADGSVDTTFRTGVYVGSVADYLPLDDGRIYVAGNFRRTEAPQDTLRLVRFASSGALDSGFDIPTFSNGSIPGIFGSYGISVQHWLDGNLLVTGKFQFVNGQPRRGICLLDTNGTVLPAFANTGIGPFTYGSITYASIERVAYDTANAQLYVCGAYNGYDDGITNYPQQRFITRLNVQEISTDVPEPVLRPSLHLWPNPATGTVWFNYHFPGNTANLQLRIRDAQGRVIHTMQAAGAEGQLVWDTRGTAPGIYTIELVRGGQLEHTEKLVIQP